MERLHPETNTFHMPFGEMTITLEDVHCLTRLKIEGLPVEFQVDEDMEDGMTYVSRLLGVTQQHAYVELHQIWGSSLRLSWLHENWNNDTISYDPHTLDFPARAYMIYVIGSVLFCDKSGARVT
ncbi:hypothetical protein ACS0TY_033440 [Phlomoides rotata]